MADVFISYKRDERHLVEQIATRLEALDLEVWFDASLNAGDTFSTEIDREVRQAKVVLVCWSPAAVASRWVIAEAQIGFTQNKLVAAYVAGPDDFDAPYPFNSLQTEDLRAWFATPDDMHANWRGLLRGVAKLCDRADLESYAALDPQASRAELQVWMDAHAHSSPPSLLMIVERLLKAREAEDIAREEEAATVRLKRQREADERRAREEEEQRKRRERNLRAKEVRARQEAEEQLRKQRSARIRAGIIAVAAVGVLTAIVAALYFVWSNADRIVGTILGVPTAFRWGAVAAVGLVVLWFLRPAFFRWLSAKKRAQTPPLTRNQQETARRKLVIPAMVCFGTVIAFAAQIPGDYLAASATLWSGGELRQGELNGFWGGAHQYLPPWRLGAALVGGGVGVLIGWRHASEHQTPEVVFRRYLLIGALGCAAWALVWARGFFQGMPLF